MIITNYFKFYEHYGFICTKEGTNRSCIVQSICGSHSPHSNYLGNSMALS